MSSPLLLIPHEIFLNIIINVNPEDVFSLRDTAKGLKVLIEGNKGLWRSVYCGVLDNPPIDFIPPGWDWEKEVKEFVVLKMILGQYPEDDRISQMTRRLEFVAKKSVELMHTANPKSTSLNVKFLSTSFDPETLKGKHNRTNFCCRSSNFARAYDVGYTSETFTQRQLSAKLHCYSGASTSILGRSKHHSPYPYACSMVYDLRNYTDDTLWGPFIGNRQATVDWEKVEAIMIVLRHNLRAFGRDSSSGFEPIWHIPWVGASPDSYETCNLSDLDVPAPPVALEDPYNVTGTWMRIVCFLDYQELFHYNFTGDEVLLESVPLPPLETTEAIRLILMELEVVSIDPPRPEDGQAYPVTRFKGNSRSLHAPHDHKENSNIRGFARMTKEGEVRWTTYSIYGGQERWKSEGVQVGGIRSARGVLGNWFDKDMDNQQGPVGPTAFWKVSNQLDPTQKHDWLESAGGDDDSDPVEDGYWEVESESEEVEG